MRWLYKLEHKLGNRYIPNLMTIIVAGMVAVYIGDMLMPAVSLTGLLSLNRFYILQGQVWRLLTFVFVPPGSQSLLIVITLYFYWIMGRSLESYWGGFRLNVYYLVGMLGAWAAMFITGYASNYYLNLALFFAFATIAPDTTFLLFFIIPLKAKWMALISAALMAFDLLNAFFISTTFGLISLVALGFSLLGYLVFFGPTLVRQIKDAWRIYNNRRQWRNRNK